MSSSITITLTNVYGYGSMDIHIDVKLRNKFLIHSCRTCHRPENSPTLASSLSLFSFFRCNEYEFITSLLQTIIVLQEYSKSVLHSFLTSESMVKFKPCCISTSVVMMVPVTRLFLLKVISDFFFFLNLLAIIKIQHKGNVNAKLF